MTITNAKERVKYKQELAEKKEIDVQTKGIRSAKDLSPRASEGKGISGEH